jgi:pyruvate dehydrogenase E2 component (dihydrolipoamide acetyltransferase)
VINLPECAILGIGRIQARPVVIDEEAETVAVRRMMALSLTFDHRAVDGGPAARFLNRVREFVERPYLWLTRYHTAITFTTSTSTWRRWPDAN